MALGAVFSGVPQRHFTESGLCAAFSGALAEGSLELLCAVPMPLGKTPPSRVADAIGWE